MALNFQPYPLEPWLIKQQNEQRPDFTKTVVDPLMQGLQLWQQNSEARRKVDLEKQLLDEKNRQWRIEQYGFDPAEGSAGMGQTRYPSDAPISSLMGGNKLSLRSGNMPVLDYFNSRLWKVGQQTTQPMTLAGQKNKRESDISDAEVRLKDAQAEYYKGKNGGSGDSGFYFIDPSTKQMFDRDLNPITSAPMGAKPKMLSNPYAGSEYARRDALANGSIDSVNKARSLMTDSVLTELKGIKLTPGKIYSQLASSDAKEVYRNLYNAISNELYLKTGATANPQEIEGKMIMYMPAANDSLADIGSRMDLLSTESSRYKTPTRGRTTPAAPNTPTEKRIRVKRKDNGKEGTILESDFNPNNYVRI